MPTENKDVKPTDIVEVEIKGKKYKVTKQFKDDMDADRAELATKVTTLETGNQTLKQKLDLMEKNPPKVKQGGDDDDVDDGEGVSFDELMLKPGSAIAKGVQSYLKKLGVDPAQLSAGNVDQKVQLALQQDKYWASFYKEHEYFDEDAHGELIRLKTRQLMPKIKDLPLKEGRKAIAEAVADMLGRKIVKGKLEFATAPKHEATAGMQLEGADGGVVDNSDNADDTNRNKGKSGSMAEDLIRRRQAREKAAKGK